MVKFMKLRRSSSSSFENQQTIYHSLHLEQFS